MKRSWRAGRSPQAIEGAAGTDTPEALPAVWEQDAPVASIARNVGTRYVGIAVEAGVGLLVLPFNVHHLGPSAYGLWMLSASITAYFSVLDLGYAGSLVRFVAQYRARRDARAINEILSTLFVVFSGLAVLAYAVALVLALQLGALFNLSAEDARVGKSVLLIVAAQVAIAFPFSVFGGIINGFQRYHLNNLVGAVASAAAGLVNVLVLLAGYHVVGVVAATTLVRLLALLVYRANSYRVFPALRIRPALFRRARLREVTGFSVFILLLDWANKINYSLAAIVIGAFLGTAAVAVWTVGQRLAEVTQRLTNQLNDILFPTIVDSDESSRHERLRKIFLSATRLSLGSVVPVGGTLMLLAHPLIVGWVGPKYLASVAITQVLAAAVIVRVGNATATTVLKGAGGHKLLTACNLSVAAANVALSFVLVRSLGLIGVALGTLLPVVVAAVFILFPAACRRAGVRLAHAVRVAVWPAAWPSLAMAAWLLLTRDWLAVTLPGVFADAVVGGVLYLALFVGVAIPTDERRLYLREVRKWIGRSPGPGASARTGNRLEAA